MDLRRGEETDRFWCKFESARIACKGSWGRRQPPATTSSAAERRWARTATAAALRKHRDRPRLNGASAVCGPAGVGGGTQPGLGPLGPPADCMVLSRLQSFTRKQSFMSQPNRIFAPAGRVLAAASKEEQTDRQLDLLNSSARRRTCSDDLLSDVFSRPISSYALRTGGYASGYQALKIVIVVHK